MLILAPFIYQALEALSDEWIVRLTKLIAVLYAWGVVCHLVVFDATAIDRPGIVNLMTMLAYYVPTKIPGGYLPIFIFGYLFRRLGAILSEEQKRLAARIGIVAWVLCFLFAGLGVPEDDPNQIWVFAAFGTFFLFDRVRIADGIGQRLVTWAAKRSYTIYLLQYTTINLIHGSSTTRRCSVTSLPCRRRHPFWSGSRPSWRRTCLRFSRRQLWTRSCWAPSRSSSTDS